MIKKVQIKVNEQYKRGTIHQLTNDISSTTEILCAGSPVIILSQPQQHIFIVEDSRGKEWYVSQKDMSDEPIREMPQEKEIKAQRRYRKMKKYKEQIYTVFFVLGILCYISVIILFWVKSILSILTAVVLLMCAGTAILLTGQIFISNISKFVEPLYFEENLKELNDLLNQKKKSNSE